MPKIMVEDISPFISVILPVFNCADYIESAVESVLNQTYTNFELIIIDDCSDDSTVEKIEKFSDSRIRLIKKELNQGITDSLNIGIGYSRGEFIARMDGDDICDQKRFEVQAHYLIENPDVGLVGSYYKIIDTNEQILVPINHDDILIGMLEYCPIAHPSVMMKSQILKKHSLFYDKKYESAEDYELWSRIIFKTKVENLPINLLNYRRHNNQISQRHNKKQNLISGKIRFEFQEKIFGEFVLDTRLDLIKEQFEHSDNSSKSFVEVWGKLNILIELNTKNKSINVEKFNSFILGKQRELFKWYFGRFKFSNKFFKKIRILIILSSYKQKYSFVKVWIVNFLSKCF